MKRKNKNIILLLFSFFCLFGLTEKIEAATEDATCTSTLYMTASSKTVYYLEEGISIYSMSLGGQRGLCADHSKSMRSGTKLVPYGCSSSNITPNMKRAVNYCSKTGCNNERELIAVQIYAWGGTYDQIAMAICSWSHIPAYKESSRGVKVITDICRSFSYTYSKQIWQTLGATSSAGTFVCNYAGPTYQRIITKVAPPCESGETEITCPPGTKNEGMSIKKEAQEIGYEAAVQEYCGDEEAACVGYQINLTGSLAICSDNNSTSYSLFKEELGSQSADYSGSENGRKIDVNIGNGEYCALYCMETRADAVLPGGLANAIAKGSAITWPTSEGTSTSRWGNMFPVEFSGQKKCKIQVAPNLTYGNSCNLEPVEMYKDYLTKMKQYYNQGKSYNYSSLVNSANQANTKLYKVDNELGVNFDVRSDKIKDVSNLNKKDEQIREFDGQTTYLNKFETYNVDEGKFFGSYRYKIIGENNADEANTEYENAKTAYCNSPKYKYTNAINNPSCENGYVDHLTGNCTGYWKDNYSCYNGREITANNQCECKRDETPDIESATVKWLKDAKDKWTNYKNQISNRYNIYKNYITQYQNALGIYQQIKYCAEYTFNCGGKTCDFYNFQTSATMEYTDEGEYGTTYSLPIEVPTSYECDTCGSEVQMDKTDALLGSAEAGYKSTTVTHADPYLEGRINAIEDKTMTIEATKTTYSLPSNLYNYIDKDKNKFVMTKPSGNFITLGLTENYDFEYSNLPTSYNNKVGKKYNLIIKDISLGDNAQYHAGAEGVSFSDYICHYQVKVDYDDCLCPPGTKNEGLDLYQALLDSNGSLSCADAKVKYCDRENVPICTTNCVEEKYCSNNPSIKITSCVNSGKSKSDCENLLCGLGNYYCDNDTRLKGMDITSCVQTRVSQDSHHSVSDALKYCNSTICELGSLFIYRTIDLKNPFPSIDADNSVTQNGLRYGMFNLNVKGRYPGYNWNGTSLVKSQILKSRGASDYKIYDQEPLYHFELNTATIMEIRDYNRKQAQNDKGYNDFTLSCVQDNKNKYLGTLCLSKFVHDPKYGGDTTSNKSLCGGAGSTNSLKDCLYKAGKLKLDQED